MPASGGGVGVNGWVPTTCVIIVIWGSKVGGDDEFWLVKLGAIALNNRLITTNNPITAKIISLRLGGR